MVSSRRNNSGNSMQVNKEFAEKLFNGNIYFEIPYFQRAYVWDEYMWDRFLDDIEAIKDTEYFMGFIVLKAFKGSGFETQHLIVDGQQRLTTFLLFARALCEINNENFELIDFYPNGQAEPILCHNHNDKEIFNHILKLEPLNKGIAEVFTKNESKILECYNYFLGEKDRLEQIDFAKVLKYLSFVCMHLTNDQDEQKIFDTMNSLGTPLRTGDLLKNELFSDKSNLSRDAEKLYEKTWEKNFEKDAETKNYWDREITAGRIKITNLDMLLHSYLAIKNPYAGKYSMQSSLFSRYKYFLKEETTNIEKLIDELMEYADIYKEHIEPEYLQGKMDDDSITQRLNIIIFGLPLTTIIPYVLYILKEVQVDEEKKKIFELLESYIMRRLISNESQKNYNNYFLRMIAKEIKSSAELKKTIYNEESDTKIPNDSSLEHGYENKIFANPAAAIVLYFLEYYKNSDESSTALLPFISYTIEHIMPRKWEGNWDHNLPEIEDAKEIRNKALKRLGNLTLITPKLNATIKKAGWQEKKEGKPPRGGLTKCCSGLATLADYLQFDDWNEDIIEKRGDELLEIAKDLWRYDPPAE